MLPHSQDLLQSILDAVSTKVSTLHKIVSYSNY
jgi:hypothetical protein